ncbi:MAG: hypothetical protein KA354_05800 [Phycisphaerae bacterium]|nr:hypothetical protein [Phycisphaerae bacterium]
MLLVCGTLLGMLASAAWAQAPDNMTVVVNKAGATGATSGITLGAFVYDPGRDCFWIGTFGTVTGFRHYDLATSTGRQCTYDSDLNRFARASDVAGGVTSADDTGKQNPSGLLLNPTSLTITVPAPGGGTQTLEYPPGSLVISNDNSSEVYVGGSSVRYAWSKKMYRWDLRTVGDPTTVQPDYDTAEDGLGHIWGAFGTVDWNDAFTVLVTSQDLIDVAHPAKVSFNQGRQPTWSSDGKSIYFVDSAPSFGGVWKVNAETGAVAWLYANTLDLEAPATERRVWTEPVAVSTGVRDFDAANPTTGDQIFFEGSTLSGNTGGLDYLLDSGSAVAGPFAALRRTDFLKWMEWNGKSVSRSQLEDGSDPGVNTYPTAEGSIVPHIWTMTADAHGTLYFCDSSEQAGVWRYDPQGRLVGVRSKRQHLKFIAGQGSASTSVTLLRMQLRQAQYVGAAGTFVVPQILFRDNGLGGISGIYAFKPGDFNRDNVVDAADVALFEAALATPIRTFSTGTTTLAYFEAPSDGAEGELESSAPVAYVDYLKYDLNCNALVTVKDRQILGRFLGKSIVDYDWDGDVDQADFGHFQACYTGAAQQGALAQIQCGDADLNGDGVVNGGDLDVFKGCFSGPEVPVDPTCGT